MEWKSPGEMIDAEDEVYITSEKTVQIYRFNRFTRFLSIEIFTTLVSNLLHLTLISKWCWRIFTDDEVEEISEAKPPYSLFSLAWSATCMIRDRDRGVIESALNTIPCTRCQRQIWVHLRQYKSKENRPRLSACRISSMFLSPSHTVRASAKVRRF